MSNQELCVDYLVDAVNWLLTLICFKKKTYFFGFAGSVRTPLVFYKEIVILNYTDPGVISDPCSKKI